MATVHDAWIVDTTTGRVIRGESDFQPIDNHLAVRLPDGRSVIRRARSVFTTEREARDAAAKFDG